jgi:SAM-dependent methyltransferase
VSLECRFIPVNTSADESSASDGHLRFNIGRYESDGNVDTSGLDQARGQIDVRALAPGLRLEPAGYWTAGAERSVSYPTTGSNFCFAVEDRSFWFAHRNAILLAAVKRFPPAPGPFFDVGGGNGCVSAALTSAGYPMVVVEPSADAAANAVRRGLSAVVRGTLGEAGFREGCGGAVGLFDVLEHIAESDDFLASVRRSLAAHGHLYVTVPAYQSLWSADDEYAGHIRRYRKQELTKVLQRAGFVVEYVTALFWWLPLPLLLFRTIPFRLARARRHAQPSAAEHTLAWRPFRTAAELTLRFEISAVRHGIPLPVGASLLAVARVVK